MSWYINKTLNIYLMVTGQNRYIWFGLLTVSE